MQEEADLAEEEDEGIAAEPDEGWGRAGAPRVVTLEQCLAWGGEQRQRCRVVLAVSGIKRAAAVGSGGDVSFNREWGVVSFTNVNLPPGLVYHSQSTTDY